MKRLQASIERNKEILELADYLLIAELGLGLPAEAIANFDRIGPAESALPRPRAASAASAGA